MNLSRLLKPVALACGLAEPEHDHANEQFYIDETEVCPHCKQLADDWKDSVVYILFGVALSICIHSAQL
jgi:hypothetical protein